MFDPGIDKLIRLSSSSWMVKLSPSRVSTFINSRMKSLQPQKNYSLWMNQLVQCAMINFPNESLSKLALTLFSLDSRIAGIFTATPILTMLIVFQHLTQHAWTTVVCVCAWVKNHRHQKSCRIWFNSRDDCSAKWFSAQSRGQMFYWLKRAMRIWWDWVSGGRMGFVSGGVFCFCCRPLK